MVAQHTILLLYVGALAADDRFTAEEMFTAFGLIGPLFAAYTTTSVRRILQQTDVEPSQPVAAERAVLVLGIPTLFFAAVALSVSWKAFGSLTFDSLVKLVGVSETFLGLYVGMVVEQLFGATRAKTVKAPH